MYPLDPHTPTNTYLHHFTCCAYSFSNMASFMWPWNCWESALPTIHAADTYGLNKNAFVKDKCEGGSFMKDYCRACTYIQTAKASTASSALCCLRNAVHRHCGFHPYRWSAALFVLCSPSRIPAAPSLLFLRMWETGEPSGPSNNNTTRVIRWQNWERNK